MNQITRKIAAIIEQKFIRNNMNETKIDLNEIFDNLDFIKNDEIRADIFTELVCELKNRMIITEIKNNCIYVSFYLNKLIKDIRLYNYTLKVKQINHMIRSKITSFNSQQDIYVELITDDYYILRFNDRYCLKIYYKIFKDNKEIDDIVALFNVKLLIDDIEID